MLSRGRQECFQNLVFGSLFIDFWEFCCCFSGYARNMLICVPVISINMLKQFLLLGLQEMCRNVWVMGCNRWSIIYMYPAGHKVFFAGHKVNGLEQMVRYSHQWSVADKETAEVTHTQNMQRYVQIGDQKLRGISSKIRFLKFVEGQTGDATKSYFRTDFH